MVVTEVEQTTSQLWTPEVSLILPAFNEASRDQNDPSLGKRGFGLGATIERYQNVLDKEFPGSWELTVIDDGSEDTTAEYAKSLGADVISYPVNYGRGHALRVGFAATHGLVRGYTDADGSYRTETILRMIERVQNGADLAIAYRAENSEAHESLLRRVGHSGLHRICERIAPTGAHDPQAGAKFFTATAAMEIWPNVTDERWVADREALWLARQADMRIDEVPAEIDPVGDSRVKILRDTRRMVEGSIAFRRHHHQAATGKLATQAA